jgi:hypothetical protein
MDSMSRIAPTLLAVLLLALAAAAPAAAARPRLTEYRLTQAEGFVRMTFGGDESAGCRERGVCGISGTSTYTFGGKPEAGEITWLRLGSDTEFMDGFFITKGETVADVTTAGSPERCVDRVPRSFDSMSLEPGRKRVRYDWRGRPDPIGDEEGVLGGEDGPDDLRTRCAGPASADIANALPRATLPYRVFRSKRSKFQVTGSRPFAGGGFAGTVEWDMRYALRFVRSRTGRPSGGDGFSF